MSFTPDTLFDGQNEPVDFRFDERTAAVFPDMIHRSIPGYATLLKLIAVVASHCVRENQHVYDLGCSLGGVSLALNRYLPASVAITAVDISSAMTERLTAYVQGAGIPNIRVLEGDILQLELQPSQLVVMNFVLQFLPREARHDVLKKIYQALPEGGTLILAEKTQSEDSRMQDWYEGFKKVQGYSALAISRKRESLEHVMQTDTESVQLARLKAVGFQKITPFFQGLMFKAWLAEK